METYRGHVRSPQDAIILFEACRLGLLPRVQRRLSEKERQSIRSGSVFVWDEREAGMRRWTDGKSWSASRVAGSFLNYREMEGKRGGSQNYNSPVTGSGAKAHGGSPHDQDMEGGEGPADGYRYKADGLVKQSFSITTTQGQHLHLISYYSRSDPHAAILQQPSTDVHLRDIHPQKGMYPDASVHDGQNMPAVTRSPMVGSYQNSPTSTHSGYPSHQRHVPSFPPGYGWPPSPMSTPPAAGHYSHYPAHTPNGYSHSPGYFPGQQQQAYGRHPPPPGPTAFDRAPPSLSNSLPPPPPPPHPHAYATQAPPSQYPPHPLHRTQSAGQSQPPPYAYQSQPPPRTAERHGNSPPYSHQHAPEAQPAPPSNFPPPVAVVPPVNSQNAASTIPSIGSLINQSPPVSHAPPPYAGSAPPPRRSPPVASAGAEKGGFSDPGIKALRQLDRHFT